MDKSLWCGRSNGGGRIFRPDSDRPQEFLERLKDGRKFVVGQRKQFMAGTFEEGKPVQVVSRDGREFISTRVRMQIGTSWNRRPFSNFQ
jgi:hypothetical protein